MKIPDSLSNLMSVWRKAEKQEPQVEIYRTWEKLDSLSPFKQFLPSATGTITLTMDVTLDVGREEG